MIGSIEIVQKRSQPLTAVNDTTGIPIVIGPCSAGPINTPVQLFSDADLVQFGAGRTVELAAMLGRIVGYPFWFCRSTTSTVSTISSVTKTYGNPVGTPVISYGSVLAPGSTVNGDVLYTAKVLGVNLVVINPGVVTPATTIVTVGQSITITLKHDGVNVTETGTALAAAIAADLSAGPLLLATPQGTGAGNPGALTSNALTDNYFNITALAPGVSYRVLVSGVNTVFATSYAAGVITVTAATNASGEPTTTMATALPSLQALALANPGVFSVASVGVAGTKLIAAKPVTTLPFGSTGTMTVSGTPTDKFQFIAKIVKGGTIGGLVPVTINWSPDGGLWYSSTASGVINPDGTYTPVGINLPTGLTLTFAGTFDVGDMFSFTTTENLSVLSDISDAMNACVAKQDLIAGFFVSTMEMSKASALFLDGVLQSAYQAKTLRAMWTARDFNLGETEEQWRNALTIDFANFLSFKGLTSAAAAPMDILSPYTGRTLRVPGVFQFAPQVFAYPKQQSLMLTSSDYSVNPYVLKIYHDERLNPGLDAARFITTRTYTESAIPGQIYTTDSPTFGDPIDRSISMIEYTRISTSGFRALKPVMFLELGKNVPVNSIDLPNGSVAGSIQDAAANRIIGLCKKVLSAIWMKQDSQSVTSFTVTIPRNYSLIDTEKLIVQIKANPLATIKKVTIEMTLEFGVTAVAA